MNEKRETVKIVDVETCIYERSAREYCTYALIDVFFSVSLLVAIIVVLYPLRKGQAQKYILDYLYLFQLA